MRAPIIIPVCFVSLWLTACASDQLNYNTVEIASTVDHVYERETLNNLSKFIDNPHAIPSQMQLVGGTFQTSNTVNPSVSLPLSAQITRSAAGVLGAVPTLSAGSALAGSGLTLGASNTGTQNYTVAPNVDQISLRNQQALYRYAVVQDADLLVEYQPPRVFIKDHFYLDPFPLQEPQCVLCAVPQGVFVRVDKPRLRINPRLKRKAWLIWDRPDDGLVPLGRHGNHDLFITREDYAQGVLTNFILFTMNYVGPAEVFSPGDGKPEPTRIIIEKAPEVTDEKTGKKRLLSKEELRTIAPTVLAPRALPSAGFPATNGQVAPQSPFNLVVPQMVVPTN